MAIVQHRLAAVWFADLSGFSQWASRDEDRALLLVRLFQDTCKDIVARFNGRVVKFLGDGALAEFSSTEAAARAACALTHAFPGIAERQALPLAKVHVGMHVGEVASGSDGDLYGEGVNLASRLEGLAKGDEVLATLEVRNQLHQRSEFQLEPQGERSIEGLDYSIPVFELSLLGVENWESMGESPSSVRARWLRGGLAGASVGVVIGLVALLALGITVRLFPRSDSKEIPPNFVEDRVAVLYLEDFTPDQHLGYLVQGLTESLIHELSKVRGVEVVSRNGVKPFASTDVRIDSIAKVLGAATLITGSVSESASLLTVSLQLVDGPTGTVIKSEKIESPTGELLVLQDDLGRQVGNLLRQRLGEEIGLEALDLGTRNREAWEVVQRARQIREEAEPLLRSGDHGVAGVQFARADSLLSRAEVLDPAWVEPAVERGLLELERVKARVETRTSLERGLEHASRALAIKPTDPGALELRAFLRYFWWALVEPDMESKRAERWLEDVERDLRAALSSEPTRASAHATLSHVLAARGAPVEAYMEARTAYEMDVYLEESQIALWRLFVSAYDLLRPGDARRWCNEGRRRFDQDPRFVQCEIWLASLPGARVDPDQVWAMYDKHLELIPAQPQNIQDRVALMAVAAALARAGLRDSSEAVAHRGRNDNLDPARELAYLQAFVQHVAGNEEQALKHLSEYLAATPGGRVEAATTWWFRELRDSPDFRRLVEADGSEQ